MLGAEGVKNAVIDRLTSTVPLAISAVAHKFGASLDEIPAPTGYYPSAVPYEDIPSGAYPFVTVTVADTDGELSSNILVEHEIIEQYQLGYSVDVVVYTQVSGQNGEPLARLQAERLILAIRESLLWDRSLDTGSEDSASVNFTRWGEDYGTEFDRRAGAWNGGAGVRVPVTTVELLDRAPYITNLSYLVGHESYAQDVVTGEEIPGTHHYEIYTKPENI